MQNVNAASAHTKEKDGDLGKLSKDGDHGKARTPSDAQSNIFVLRKMVEEVFTVLYSKRLFTPSQLSFVRLTLEPVQEQKLVLTVVFNKVLTLPGRVCR